MTKELQQKAEREAFEHTVFRALADIYSQLHPDTTVGEWLEQLSANKEAEKNRIINSIIYQNP